MAKIEEFVWKCLRLLLGSKNTIKFSVNTSPYFHSALLVMWTVTVLCCNEAILASYPFLGLLLIREGLDDLTAGAWAACVSARSVLPTLLKYFFGSESLALLLPRILFASRREARRNFQHGAPSTKNDVPTHAQGRSKGISSFMIVRRKAIFHCYIYVAAFLVKKIQFMRDLYPIE